MLAPDVAGTQAAASNLVDFQNGLMPYLTAVITIPLGPQPLTIDGQPAGTYDPLSGYPGLEQSLREAQGHCWAFDANVSQPLHLWAVYTVPDYNDQFQAQTQTVLDVIAQLGGSPPTPAQRQTVQAALAALSSGLADSRARLTQAQTNLPVFLDQVTADHQTFTVGEDALGELIPRVQQDIDNDIIQYSMGFGGAAIADLVGQIGGQMIGYLNKLDGAVGEAKVESEQAGAAMSALMTGVDTLGTKYDAVAAQVAAAGDEEFGSVLQQLDIQVARTDWQQLTDFLQSCGL